MSFKIYYYFKIFHRYKVKDFQLEAFLDLKYPNKSPVISFFFPLNLNKLQQRFHLIPDKDPLETDKENKILQKKEN